MAVAQWFMLAAFPGSTKVSWSLVLHEKSLMPSPSHPHKDQGGLRAVSFSFFLFPVNHGRSFLNRSTTIFSSPSCFLRTFFTKPSHSISSICRTSYATVATVVNQLYSHSLPSHRVSERKRSQIFPLLRKYAFHTDISRRRLIPLDSFRSQLIQFNGTRRYLPTRESLTTFCTTPIPKEILRMTTI